MSSMAILKTKLPPHCQVKNRGGYIDVYFTVHPKDRPEGWPATIKLGRTDKVTPEDITAKAHEIYDDYMKFRSRLLGLDDLAAKKGTLLDVIKSYRALHHYRDLGTDTKKVYDLYLKWIEEWSKKNHHPHVKELTTPQAVKFLNTFEDKPVKQQKMKAVFSILCRVAIEEGHIDRNPVKEIKLRKRQTGKRKIVVWSESDVCAFIEAADKAGWSSLGTALLIAFETGQRQGDILSLQKPRDYQDGKFIFKQSKTGKEVRISATQRLRSRLDALPAAQLMLVRNESTGKQWQKDYFKHKFRDIADDAGLPDHIFQQARHSAVNNLERAGNSISQISAVTGHSRRTVQMMMDAHYGVDRDEEMANQAITNLEAYRKSHTKKSDGSHTK